MRKYKFISTLRFLEVQSPIDTHFTLLPGVDLITDRKKITEIADDEVISVAGLIEASNLSAANHVIFYEDDESMFKQARSSREALIVWLTWINLLICDSWLIKDSAITCEVAYCKLTDGEHTEWSNNMITGPVSKSDGQQFTPTIFTLEDLTHWESQSHKLQDYLHSKKSGFFSSFTDKQFSRIGRAYRFVSAARKEPHVALKLAHYCSALESLFSTDSMELSHKLSERVALFLRPYEFDPMIVFADIKTYYGIRSKVTHGDGINSSKVTELPSLSMKCDDYLRSIFDILINDKKLQEIFDGDKSKFEEYFRELMFSRKS